jgi:hypothetical protein
MLYVTNPSLDQLRRHCEAAIIFGLRLDRCGLIIIPQELNTLSGSSDISGIEKIVRASFCNLGYVLAIASLV